MRHWVESERGNSMMQQQMPPEQKGQIIGWTTMTIFIMDSKAETDRDYETERETERGRQKEGLENRDTGRERRKSSALNCLSVSSALCLLLGLCPAVCKGCIVVSFAVMPPETCSQ